MSKVHKLKTHPKHFQDVLEGFKKVELRLNDRDFKVSDILDLEEWDPETEKYTERVLTVLITHILKGGQFGLDPKYVAMSVMIIKKPRILG